MRKVIPVILFLLLMVNLIGCNNPKSYNFEFKFKEEYADLISPGFGAAFIDFTRDTLQFYREGFNDFEITKIEKEMNGYMGKVVLEYNYDKNSFNDHEKEILDIMLMQWDNMNLLQMKKVEHKRDEIQKSIGLKPGNEEKYYNDILQEIKGRVEDTLEQAKKFID